MFPRFPIFVATRREDVPGMCRRYLSVDGAVPGAVETWDHHQTGEPVNLAAMPPRVDPRAYDGVGTTLADTDALASVVAVLLGGPAALPPHARDTLLAASWWCDHLGPHPALDRAANRRGRRLDAYLAHALSARAPRSEFGRLCRLVADRVRRGRPLPGRSAPVPGRMRRALARRVSGVGDVTVADLRGLGAVPPLLVYRARPEGRVAVFVAHHPHGGARYTVGRNPLNPGAPVDMRPILHALAVAEHAHGPPARRPEAVPGAENWGGRREVGGSPWNYGSRLGVGDVVDIVRRALATT